MSAQHTPGPWTYVRNPELTRWIIDSLPAHAIACTAGYEPDNEANARLISAAPDLLNALQRFVDQARVGSGNKAVTRSARVNCPAGIYHDARAAIAKAVQS